MTNHIWLLFPILSFILHFSPKNGSYVYQTYRLSGEMLFFETLHDFYRKQYIENCFLRDSRNSREATLRNEFGKFMSYFACCLATCPWWVCCIQEEKERTNIILNNLLTNLNFKENENEWDLWGSRAGGSECDDREGIRGICWVWSTRRRLSLRERKVFITLFFN